MNRKNRDVRSPKTASPVIPMAGCMKNFSYVIAVLAGLQIVGCASMARQSSPRDLAHYPFPNAQAELRSVLKEIVNDVTNANVEGLRDSHLKSEKFTKFAGGKVYERMNYDQCIATETAAITSVQDYKVEVRNLKIDVFGDVAIMTYYPHKTKKKNHEVIRSSARQTLVFLKTADGWKIIHEHQSKQKFEK